MEAQEFNLASQVKGVVNVLKIHGDAHKPGSICLSAKELSEQYGATTYFHAFLKDLFSTHTVVFIGASLEDSEPIVSLLQEVKTEATAKSTSLPKHFALLSSSAASMDKIKETTGVEIVSYEADPLNSQLWEFLAKLDAARPLEQRFVDAKTTSQSSWEASFLPQNFAEFAKCMNDSEENATAINFFTSSLSDTFATDAYLDEVVLPALKETLHSEETAQTVLEILHSRKKNLETKLVNPESDFSVRVLYLETELSAELDTSIKTTLEQQEIRLREFGHLVELIEASNGKLKLKLVPFATHAEFKDQFDSSCELLYISGSKGSNEVKKFKKSDVLIAMKAASVQPLFELDMVHFNTPDVNAKAAEFERCWSAAIPTKDSLLLIKEKMDEIKTKKTADEASKAIIDAQKADKPSRQGFFARNKTTLAKKAFKQKKKQDTTAESTTENSDKDKRVEVQEEEKLLEEETTPKAVGEALETTIEDSKIETTLKEVVEAEDKVEEEGEAKPVIAEKEAKKVKLAKTKVAVGSSALGFLAKRLSKRKATPTEPKTTTDEVEAKKDVEEGIEKIEQVEAEAAKNTAEVDQVAAEEGKEELPEKIEPEATERVEEVKNSAEAEVASQGLEIEGKKARKGGEGFGSFLAKHIPKSIPTLRKPKDSKPKGAEVQEEKETEPAAKQEVAEEKSTSETKGETKAEDVIDEIAVVVEEAKQDTVDVEEKVAEQTKTDEVVEKEAEKEEVKEVKAEKKGKPGLFSRQMSKKRDNKPKKKHFTFGRKSTASTAEGDEAAQEEVKAAEE